MKIFKIGYQGIEGSWAEEATRIFIKKLGLKNTRAIPLINSRTVAKKLIDGDIDYGVMAVKNSIGGTVAETSAAMMENFLCIFEIDLPVHHCLFKKSGVHINKIRQVASHEQAIKQTRENIRKILGDVTIINADDTALSAKLLSENNYSDNTAIICSQKAGKKYELDCIAKNIEDKESITKFVLLKNELF